MRLSKESKESVLSLVAALVMLAILSPAAFGQNHDFRICAGDYALCAASICTPTGGQILVNTATGKSSFPAANCTCPIVNGNDIVDVTGGNMRGSCETPNTATIWSGYSLQATIPQALSNWQEADAPGLLCGKDQMQGNQLANCFSFKCVRAGKINGVEVATCTCPLGESFDGSAVPADTAFFTQAGQCSLGVCSQHPVSGIFGFDDATQGGQCIELQGGGSLARGNGVGWQAKADGNVISTLKR